MSVLGMTPNHLMLRRKSHKFREYEVPVPYGYFQDFFDPEKQYLLGSHLWAIQNFSTIYYSWNHLPVCKRMIKIK